MKQANELVAPIIKDPVNCELTDLIEHIFFPGGALSKFFNNYAYRRDQTTMSLVIAKALMQNKSAIIEAGTGTGKSFGELAPTVAEIARQNYNVVDPADRKRLFITTHNIALQQQLYDKDVPVVKDVLNSLGLDFKAVLLKGKNNYVCLKKLEKALKRPTQELLDLIPYLANDKGEIIIGDKERITVKPTDELWSEISADMETSCEGCPHRTSGACFYYHCKASAKDADVIIGNQFLLMADLCARYKADFKPNSGLIPDYHMVVIDESHHIEEVASGFLGFKVDPLRIKKILARTRSLFNGELRNYDKQDRRKKGLALCDEIEKQFQIAYDQMIEIMNRDKFKSASFLLDEPLKGDFKCIEELQELLIFIEVRDLNDDVKKKCNSIASGLQSLKKEILDFQIQGDTSENAYWVYINKEQQAEFNVTPLEVNKYLRKMIFERMPAVLTSATIKFDKDLSFFADKVGCLKDEEYESAFMQSPFDYKSQVCFYIPGDGLASTDEGYDDYCMEEMERLVSMSKGRAFLLFTSYSTMREYYKVLAPKFEAMGYPCLMQGQMERTKMIEVFKAKGNAVLFGADTFWEGIDIRGRELSLVVIQKLPFNPPTPVDKAREVIIRKRGGNPFLENSVFGAVTKYKQGFGRLIRHENDKGVFCVLDTRILSHKATYGKFFLQGTPDTQRTVYREDLPTFFE